MDLVKKYRPETRSISSGQVLTCAYTVGKAKIVVLEMVDALALDLIDKRLVTDQIVLEIGYDVESLADPEIRSRYDGRIAIDHYGRQVPFHAHGTATMATPTSSSDLLTREVAGLFDKIVNPLLLVRRITLCANHLVDEGEAAMKSRIVQLDLFADYEEINRKEKERKESLARERRRQEAVLKIKRRFGKNAILKGLNYADGATQKNRNRQIGGHHE